MSNRECNITYKYDKDKPDFVIEMLIDYSEGVRTCIKAPSITEEEDYKRKEECNRIALVIWQNMQSKA